MIDPNKKPSTEVETNELPDDPTEFDEAANDIYIEREDPWDVDYEKSGPDCV